MSLLATTRKLGINFHDYVLDRFLRMGHIPPLADLIHDRAQQLDLDASWQVASLTPKF
jgi:hypothetical protein